MVADGVTTNYTYDKNNRLTKTNTNGAMVDYNYDNNGNLYSKVYSRITPATGEAEGVGLELFGQAQATPASLAMEEQPLTVEEILSILEQEPGKSIKEILAERRPAMLAAAKKEKTAEFFTYNERGQLTDYTDGTTTASYTYGADGYRKSKTVNGKTTTHIWDGGQVVKELGAKHKEYYRSGSEILVGNTGWMGNYTYLTDGHGNVTQMTARGFEVEVPIEALLEDYEYDAYGNQSKYLVVGNPFQYCGEYYDEETDMT